MTKVLKLRNKKIKITTQTYSVANAHHATTAPKILIISILVQITPISPVIFVVGITASSSVFAPKAFPPLSSLVASLASPTTPIMVFFAAIPTTMHNWTIHGVR